jgi:SAM-dependent methyltransferase
MDIEGVFDYYRELLTLHNPRAGMVLKTDCFNEGIDDFRHIWGALDPDRTVYLEIDGDTIDKAKVAHPEGDYRQGDIRKLPFDDVAFSAIFDLSTIDHVPPSDTGVVLSEYHRTLMPGGKLVLVAWCAEERKDEPVDWGGPQYFLYEADIVEGLRGFQVCHREVIHHGEGVYLVNFVAERTCDGGSRV